MILRRLPVKSLIAIFVLAAVLGSTAGPVYAADIVLDDGDSCTAIGGSGFPVCIITTVVTFPADSTLEIPEGVTLRLENGLSGGSGIFINEGAVINNGLIDARGGSSDKEGGGRFANEGELVNNGTIELFGSPDQPGGRLDNSATMTNNGSIILNGGVDDSFGLGGLISNRRTGILTNNGTITANGRGYPLSLGGSILNAGALVNNSAIELNGGIADETGLLLNEVGITLSDGKEIVFTGSITNNGTITANGGSGTGSGSIINLDLMKDDVTFAATIDNRDTIQLNGGEGDNSGSLINHGIVNNHCRAEINGPVVDEGGAVNEIPCTPEERIDFLIEDVEDLGLPSNTQMQLLKKLTGALEKLEADKPDGAVGKLKGFIGKVDDLLTEGVIDQHTANSLTANAQEIIDLIDS